MSWFWCSCRPELLATKAAVNQVLTQQKQLAIEFSEFQEHVNNRLSEIESMLCTLLRRGELGPVGLIVTGERFMDTKKLKFTLVLPPKSAPDVATRELTVKIGDAEPVVSQLAGDTVEVADLLGDADALVEVSLADIDGNDNRGPASSNSFRLVDTIAPPAPGEIGLLVTGEVFPDVAGPAAEESLGG